MPKKDYDATYWCKFCEEKFCAEQTHYIDDVDYCSNCGNELEEVTAESDRHV